MNKTRIEAFIDAILAIILTVLVLEFHTPTRPSLFDLLSEWHIFASYTATFVLIIFSWYNQHNLFQHAKHISIGCFVSAAIWTFTMSLLPLATAFVGKYPEYWGAELFYMIIATIWSLAFDNMAWHFQKANQDIDKLKYYVGSRLRPKAIIANYLPCLVSISVVYFFPMIGILMPAVVIFTNYLLKESAKETFDGVIL